jgi:hypothetical protein
MEERKLSKFWVLGTFWLVGFTIGIIAWFSRAPFVLFFENFGLTEQLSQAMIAGFFGSIVMVLAVVFWAFISPSS